MKLEIYNDYDSTGNQPPSGGCVLKRHPDVEVFGGFVNPAAFRRLCVETCFGLCL